MRHGKIRGVCRGFLLNHFYASLRARISGRGNQDFRNNEKILDCFATLAMTVGWIAAAASLPRNDDIIHGAPYFSIGFFIASLIFFTTSSATFEFSFKNRRAASNPWPSFVAPKL